MKYNLQPRSVVPFESCSIILYPGRTFLDAVCGPTVQFVQSSSTSVARGYEIFFDPSIVASIY